MVRPASDTCCSEPPAFRHVDGVCVCGIMTTRQSDSTGLFHIYFKRSLVVGVRVGEKVNCNTQE